MFSVPEDSTSRFLVALCLECSRPEDSTSSFLVALCLECSRPEDSTSSFLGASSRSPCGSLCPECSRSRRTPQVAFWGLAHARHAALSVLSVLGPGKTPVLTHPRYGLFLNRSRRTPRTPSRSFLVPTYSRHGLVPTYSRTPRALHIALVLILPNTCVSGHSRPLNLRLMGPRQERTSLGDLPLAISYDHR